VLIDATHQNIIGPYSPPSEKYTIRLPQSPLIIKLQLIT